MLLFAQYYKLQHKYYGEGKKPKGDELVEYEKKKNKIAISFTADFAVRNTLLSCIPFISGELAHICCSLATRQDWMRVLPGFCGMYAIGPLRKHDGFSGLCGVVVGLVGSYKVVVKCK